MKSTGNSGTHAISSRAQDVPIESVDGQWFREALMAGIYRVIAHRDYLNKINVFPVADADTGTNLAMSMHAVLVGATQKVQAHLGNFLEQVADHALDGARGNSGAIFAQYWQGFYESVAERATLTTSDYAAAAFEGSRSAHTAIAEPREGTMLTVIRDYALSLKEQVARGVSDFRALLDAGLEQARVSLARTPELLDVLKQAGVVDAGAHGFVDMLEGFQEYLQDGLAASVLPAGLQLEEEDAPRSAAGAAGAVEHRFCTECMITGAAIDRRKLHDRMLQLGCSSLVIAGTKRKVRVHIHVNNPAAVFLACEEFGEVSSQKADDMRQQMETTHSRHGRVAIVADTGADIPDEEMERLHVHLVPLRVNLSDRQYLDKLSLDPGEFYQLLRDAPEYPKTSQPPPGDFRRQFEFLKSHFEAVLSVNVSSALSGTVQAAQSAAKRVDERLVGVYDTLNASAGQGLMALYAAEAAQENFDLGTIRAALDYMRPRTRTFAVIKDLSYGVRGGRIPRGIKRIADVFRLTPIIGTNQGGRVVGVGVLFSRHELPKRFARWLARRINKDQAYRLLIAHCDERQGARELRDLLVNSIPMVHSVMLTAAGTAVGAHAGPGSLVVGIQEYLSPEDWYSQFGQQRRHSESIDHDARD